MAKTPRIDRLLAEGMSRTEVYGEISRGMTRDVSRTQLEAIGMSPTRINRILTRQRNRRTGGTDGPVGTNPAEQFNESAFDTMRMILSEYGLDSLSDRLRDLIQGGVTDQASITLALQDTQEWKDRFAGNEKLKKAGLPVLSVAEYLATERTYSQIMKNHGLPSGFYDDPSDFGEWIGNSVSPAELESRVSVFADLVNREDPAITAQLRAMGMTTGDILAFTMDPERANPLIQKKYQTTLIGAAARRTGIETDAAYAERLAGMGLTEQQAQAGYSLISENLGDVDKLADIYGEDYNQRDFESEVFEGDGKATRKRKRLASQERAAFSGQSGVGQGSLRQSSAGQY